MALFEISGLSFRYPKSEAYALKDVDIVIGQGDFVTLVGPTGSGKSTLLRLLNAYKGLSFLCHDPFVFRIDAVAKFVCHFGCGPL